MSFTFGRTTSTTNYGSASTDYKYASRYYLAKPGYLQSLTALVSVDGGGSAPTRLFIYDIDGDAYPDALLGSTTAQTIPAGTGKHWRTFVFASPIYVPLGYFYLGAHAGSSTLNLYRDDTGGYSEYHWDEYADGPSNPWGAFAHGTRSYCIFGTLTEPNVAPNAPGSLSPSGGTTINPLVSQTITWVFSDDDEGDSQSAYNHRYRIVGAEAWTQTGWVSSPYCQHVYPGATFDPSEDYEHEVQTKDALGLEGPWCSAALFSTAEPPDAPNITDPANEATISTPTYDMDWSIADQDAFQARRLADDDGDPDTGTIYEDTGTVEEADTRTHTWTLAVNDRTEHWQVRVRHDAVWGDWGSVKVNIAFTAPMTPSLVVTVFSTSGYISLTPTQPTPEGEPLPPTVVAMHVYRTETDSEDDAVRIAADADPEADYLDWQVADCGPNGPSYRYYIVAVAENGATADSELEG